MRLSPVMDNLFIEEVEQANKGGIVLPDNVIHEWKVGKVLKAGPGRYTSQGVLIKTIYKPGDVVVFSGNAAMDVEAMGEQVKMIGSQNVIGVLS